MPVSRDLFDDSQMSFGEHLEVLRVHVWKSLIGVVIGIVLCLIFGREIIAVLRGPIENALENRGVATEELDDSVSDVDFVAFLKGWWSGEKPPGSEEQNAEPELPEVSDGLTVFLSRNELREILQQSGGVVSIDETQEVTPTAEETGEAKPDQKLVLTLRSPELAEMRRALQDTKRPVTFKVEEAFTSYIKVCCIAGFVAASPWVFFQIWQFVAAGLYQHERRYVYVYLPMSLGLFLLGAVFCFAFVFPLVLNFLITFADWIGVSLQPRLSDYLSLAMLLPLMFGISFQLPMAMLFLERIGVFTRENYLTNWRMAVLVISVLSMLLTPSDPGSMMLMMFPLILLYFFGIALCKFQPKGLRRPVT